jgi:hypothetical protein
MKRYIAFTSALLLTLPVLVHAKSEQEKKSEQVKIVSSAEILKIDAKKKSLEVQDLLEPSATDYPDRGRRNGSGGGGRRGGGGGGGGGSRRGGGVGFPGGGVGFPGGRPGGGAQAATPPKHYKVFVSKETVLKIADMDMTFSDMHVGDRILISGTPRGSNGDIDATSITRDLH